MEPSKKRPRTEEESSPRTLLISVYEDGFLTFYSVPSDVVTDEVIALWDSGIDLSCIFSNEDEMDPKAFSKLPECIKNWKGKIRREESKGACVYGNWKNAIIVRDWA